MNHLKVSITFPDYSFVATEANQVVLIWFCNAEFDFLKHIDSITCEDLVFRKRAEKDGTSQGLPGHWFNTGGLMRMEVWWALTTRPMNRPVPDFRV